MDYKKYMRDDIDIKILSNYPFDFADFESDFEKFKKKLTEYDFGVWVDGEKTENVRWKMNELEIFNNKKEKLSWEDVVLNYLNFLNTFMREQIGVSIEKKIPRILDNTLTYLIVQRKNYKDFDNNFFIAFDGEVIFPMINKDFDISLALLKLAEWKNRAGKNLVKYQY